jgi:Fic family protein
MHRLAGLRRDSRAGRSFPALIRAQALHRVECLGRAFNGTETTLAAVLRKARFWERHAQATINERQRVILNRLLDGFVGHLTTTKWATFANSSHDTALRDIHDLIEQGILKNDTGGGRSTSYSLKER